jgi:nucleotide-binding universal stress UspA family protein
MVMSKHRKILVAFDGSSSALFALEEAADLARRLGLELHALWIKKPLSDWSFFVDCSDEIRESVWAKERAEREEQHRIVQERLRACSTSCGVPIVSEVRSSFQRVKTILCVAAAGAYDLIVLGSAERQRLRHRLFGNTADWVNHRARCDVLIVRKPTFLSNDA